MVVMESYVLTQSRVCHKQSHCRATCLYYSGPGRHEDGLLLLISRHLLVPFHYQDHCPLQSLLPSSLEVGLTTRASHKQHRERAESH